MAHDPERQRKRKRLLVASVGVATVSFMGLQTGCEDTDGQMTFTANLLAIPLDSSVEFASATDASSARLDANAPPIPISGNLIAPNAYDAGPKDAASDALMVSGNLVAPPPPDAATDAASDAAPKDGSANDAHVDTGIPASGNLLPPLGPR